MKTLTVKQPFASAIVHGIKDVENRNWSTDYRGPVLIHSAKTGTNIGEIRDDRFPLIMDVSQNFNDSEAAFKKPSLYYKMEGDILTQNHDFTEMEMREEAMLVQNYEGLPFSAIVGVANLVAIVKGADSKWAESNCYHWHFEPALSFSLPEFEINGKLRLWDFPTEKLNKSALQELTAWR